MEKYQQENTDFKILLKDAYEKFPLLRLFYGEQLIQLYEQTQKKANEGTFHLLNSVCLNIALCCND